jgi:hypothetical protein
MLNDLLDEDGYEVLCAIRGGGKTGQLSQGTVQNMGGGEGGKGGREGGKGGREGRGGGRRKGGERGCLDVMVVVHKIEDKGGKGQGKGGRIRGGGGWVRVGERKRG